MATIYSNRNDSTATHTTVLPNATTTWAGGIVPSVADQVYVVGRRTLVNQAAFAKWTSTRTITVDSTTYFPTAGFFYTHTNGGQIVKVNYTGTTATTFTGCTVDETDSFYVWNDAQTIADNSYVHNPAYVISINSGDTFECNELIIQEGGWVLVNGGTLKVNQGIILRDGRLTGNAGNVYIDRQSNLLNNSNVGYLSVENYPISIMDLNGGENRVYATLSATANKGATSVSVTGVTNGSFAVGDEVAIYEYEDYRRRNVGYTGYRDASASFYDMDEGFDVAGVSGSTIHLATRNGARGDIKSVATVGSQKVLNVDSTTSFFKAGDKIIVNNVAYTVDRVEDSEHTLYEYDFTNPSTDLSDFWIDASDHAYSSGWVIEAGVGIKNTSGGYRELINKYVWRRDVVIEAEMSPLDGYYTGTRGTADYGILTSYDPAFRQGSRSFDSFKTDIFRIDDGADAIAFYIRTASNYPNNRLSRDNDLRTLTRGPVSYKVDNRKSFTKCYINNVEFTNELRRDGAFKGLVGIFSDAASSMRCKSMKIKAPTQKLYITTTANFTVGHVAYRSDTEHNHPVGSRIVKISSSNTGGGSHADLAFAYRGQRGNGEWPVMVQINGAASTSTNLVYMHNHDMNLDYYYDHGNVVGARSATVDLGSQKTFTHVSFSPRFSDIAGTYGMNGVTIYGSNDLSSWTTIYATTNDTKKWFYASYNRLAFYSTGSRSFRYVKFETTGNQSTANYQRYVNIGVHNFTEGYTLELNNASDLNIGDTITVMSDSGYSWGSREVEAYEAVILNNADPDEYHHGGWHTECTITNKSGNKIFLDKPIFWGYIEGSDSVTVVKTNRNLIVAGTFGNTNYQTPGFSGRVGNSSDWRWPTITFNGGGATGKKYIMRNVKFNYIGSSRYASTTDHGRGFRNYSYDYWNAVNVDGCVHNFSCDGSTYLGVGSYAGHTIWRNCVIMNMRSFWWRYNTSWTGNAVFNTKILNVLSTYLYDNECFAFNFNEIATCDTGINVTNLRTSRLIVPRNNEIRRNLIKGTSYTAINMFEETVGPRRIPRIKMEYNKIRATDDYTFVGRFFSGSPMVATDAAAEHTGSRLSRYRNEGPVAQGDTSSDLSYVFPQHDFGRYGYDITYGLYHTLVKKHEFPDVLEVYNPQGDDYFAFLGMELDVRENVPFKVEVKFDYSYDWMKRLQADGALSGQLRCYAIQHGAIIDTEYGAVPSSMNDGWYTLSKTFTFSGEEGVAGVYLAMDGQNSRIRIKNSHATVLTDNPSDIYVIGNTFNIQRIWDQYHENKDTAPLGPLNGGVAARTIKLNRFKF